jgi:chromosome partitioning protein
MKTILIAAQKGGAGKTTLARNIGVAASQDGLRALLIDLDPQQSLREWWRLRQSPEPSMLTEDPSPSSMASILPRITGVDLVIIDTPPRSEEWIADVAALATLVLIPVRPSPTDLRAIRTTLKTIRQARADYAFVLSQTRRTRLATEAARVIAAQGSLAPTNLNLRVSHEEADATGHAALETTDALAASEVTALWAYIKDRLNA